MPMTPNSRAVIFSGVPLRQQQDISEQLYFCCKRIIDIIISLFLIVLFALPLVVMAVIIWLTSPGLPFFTQRRGGLNGKMFTIIKLRSFYSHLCDDGRTQVKEKDSRVTPVGNWLRKRSLDELPQLLNILIGDMSLIGPRPHSVAMDEDYGQYISFYYTRYRTKPGLTGMAQVYGAKGETKLVEDMERRILLDIQYIDQQSFALDTRIFARSAIKFLKALC
jgi:putative colanic acid biosynthesis UDP-glucose lipid carrier transferase